MMRGSTLRPLLDTPAIGLRTLVVAAGSLNSSTTIGFSRLLSILACLHPQAPHHLELVALCSLTIVSVVIHEIRDGSSKSEGVLV